MTSQTAISICWSANSRRDCFACSCCHFYN